MSWWSCISSRSKKQELLSRTALETHKLDLMAEISALKLKLATSEKTRSEHEEKLLEAQKRIDELQGRLNDKTIEVNSMRVGKITANGGLSTPDPSDANRSLERGGTFDKEKTLDRLRRKHTEVERLKKVVESLMTTNTEKDKHIDELGRLIKKYRRLEEMMVATQGRKCLEGLGLDDDVSSTSSTQNSASSNENTVRDNLFFQYGDRPLSGEYGENHNLPAHRGSMPDPSATSTPMSCVDGKPPLPHLRSPASVVSTLSFTPKRSTDVLLRSNSAEDITPVPNKTSPTLRRSGQGYAQTEVDEEALKDEMARQYKALQTNGGAAVYDNKKKHKGIKRFFGKLRRSSSQDMDGEGLESFRRNGLRATAGPRLGWSKDCLDPELPFARWDSDRVSAWLHSIGLSMYVGECKRWVKNGRQLQQASSQDLDKELCMRNPFHRKKLHLALSAVTSDKNTAVDDLDHNWVTRWLDDIGLPQYKDQFLEARIDGRMLHTLTVDELVCLRITNTMHHLSIKRGIQVLRVHNFNPNALKRRPSLDDGHMSDIPREVCLWTNHRVMEWLRTIDLSEYAPNLRGSGVHGGLMVLEARFSSDLFASILSIPASKTLLRRHLCTHFVSLVGTDVQYKKREVESEPGYVPLTPNQKVKLKKFGLFGTHKRARSYSESEDLICPIEGARARETHTNGVSQGSYRRDGSLTRQQSLPRQPSTDIRHTHMLNREKFLEDVPSSNV